MSAHEEELAALWERVLVLDQQDQAYASEPPRTLTRTGRSVVLDNDIWLEVTQVTAGYSGEATYWLHICPERERVYNMGFALVQAEDEADLAARYDLTSLPL